MTASSLKQRFLDPLLKSFRVILPAFFLLLTSCSHASREELPSAALPKRLAPLIIIDPGHGGKDHGTESAKKPPYIEKQLTLETAELLQRDLRGMGFRTLMTRECDQFISLEERYALANRMKAELFVSVHYNAAPSKTASGIEVFYFQGEKEEGRARASKRLAELILKESALRTGAKARGAKKGNYAVIRETKMPAALIECGFLTNAAERERLLTRDYRKKLAAGIAHGIRDYFCE